MHIYDISPVSWFTENMDLRFWYISPKVWHFLKETGCLIPLGWLCRKQSVMHSWVVAQPTSDFSHSIVGSMQFVGWGHFTLQVNASYLGGMHMCLGMQLIFFLTPCLRSVNMKGVNYKLCLVLATNNTG